MYFFVFKLKHILIFAAIITAAVLFCTLSKSVPAFSVNGREIPIYSVERRDSKAALTFDCAWNAEDIYEILDALDKFGVSATFFVTGDWAEKYSDALIEISKRGHQIGTHSVSHTDYTTLSPGEIMGDIEKCENIIEDITGIKPYILRAPSGSYNDKVIKVCEENNRICIQWSVDGLDYTDDATPGSIYERVIGKAADGDIILLHNGTEYTSEILPEILSELTKHLELVRIDELIYPDNFSIDNTGRQHLN